MKQFMHGSAHVAATASALAHTRIVGVDDLTTCSPVQSATLLIQDGPCNAVAPTISWYVVNDAMTSGCKNIMSWSLRSHQVMAVLSSWCVMQSNLAKQLGKLVKVKYVEDITDASRVGECTCLHHIPNTVPDHRIPVLLSPH